MDSISLQRFHNILIAKSTPYFGHRPFISLVFIIFQFVLDNSQDLDIINNCPDINKILLALKKYYGRKYEKYQS